MKYINNDVKSRDEALQLIISSENEFSASLDRAVSEVIFDLSEKSCSKSGGIRAITLSGPTCSGKTTTANRLIRRITESGYNAVVMSIDDFFRDRKSSNTVSGNEEKPDYDTVNAIDLDEFGRCVAGLIERKPTLIPHYDFTTGKRDAYTEYYPTELDIYIFEGIQAVYPEVVHFLGDNYKSIFINVEDDVSSGDIILSRHDIRLLRRIVRDYKFRNAHPEFTLFLWDNVRENEEKNIYANASNCDVYINSFLPYELFIITKYVLPLLAQVPADSAYRFMADKLTEKLENFNNPCFEEIMVPVNSVFREFIGR